MNRLRGSLAALLVLVVTAACGTQNAAAPPPGATPKHGHGASTAPAQPLRDGERFVTLTMPEPYTPKGPNGASDDYRCFLIDPGTQGTGFLTGAQFQPLNLAIVHHAIFFRLAPEQVAEAKRMDAAAPGQGWTCFADAGVREAGWVAHWAPGDRETLLDPKYGHPIPPGSQLVMQVHYNTRAGDGADQSAIRLRVSDKQLEPLGTALFPAAVELPCAPGESGPLCDRKAAVEDIGRRFGAESARMQGFLTEMCGPAEPGPTQHCDIPVPREGLLHALAGHMHLLGRSIKIELNPGKPDARTLLDVPDYNFDDQALRPLPAPVKVGEGDVVRVTCTHDAKLRGMLPQLANDPARYVVWGEGTADEMCLGVAIMSA
ncbi:monooxygenase [Herbidospora sp. NEAU-GS84]|uniref:Monooxygenase n=1 Tax=Herbidospora solisilvae TaxID=2696284 RepID=A0A7C9NC57_9ACTN|nr:monooxygenase [Herbidospora solisilvae]NAS27073.1 monooxygenase [Herbidospora solisilvae]